MLTIRLNELAYTLAVLREIKKPSAKVKETIARLEDNIHSAVMSLVHNRLVPVD